MIYTYFMTQRPAAPGTHPKEGLLDVYSWEKKTYIEEIHRSAWSELHYARPLTEKEISDYELIPYPIKKKGEA